ncbi:MAG: S41 family peptidase [Dehalococcoidia bacterium]
MQRPRLNRLVLVVLLAIGSTPFLRGSDASISYAAPAQQAPADRLDVVQEAFNALYTGFVFPVPSDQLLGDAWDGLNAALSAAGKTPVTRPPFSGDASADWNAFAAAYRRVVATGLVPSRDLAYGAINQMAVARNSCHTAFLPPERAASINGEETHQPTDFTGFVADRVSNVIYRVYPDSPADRAGIRAGDMLLTSDGQGPPGLQHRIVVAPAGQPLTVTVQRPGVPDPIAVMLVPELTVLPFIRTAVLPGGIGVIQFDDFTVGAGQQAAIRQALADFEAQGVVGWVLDLRTSPGGDSHTMAAIASLFLSSGRVVTEIDRAGGSVDINVDGISAVQPQRPLVVLTEKFSASAADILPGALQDNGRAYVIGATSDGCVSSSLIHTLADGSDLQVEIVQVLVGNDSLDLNGVGVTPDETIVRTPELLASGQDPQLDRAAEYLLSVAGH